MKFPLNQQDVRLIVVALHNYKEHCQFINKTSIHQTLFTKKWIHKINLLLTIFMQLDSCMEDIKTYNVEVKNV